MSGQWRAFVLVTTTLWGSAEAASGLSLSGLLIGVSFSRNPNDNYVFSDGVATALDETGSRAWIARVVSAHRIYQVTTNVTVGVDSADEPFGGQAVTYLDGYVDEGCYRAEVFAQALESEGIPSTVQGVATSRQRCVPPEIIIEIPDENCPLVIDVNRDGYRLTSAAKGVQFDIDADGSPDQIGWVVAGGDDAFLCRDLNGNGRIDDGRELLSWAAPLADGSPSEVPFTVLAELDRTDMGGNSDGLIDSRDAAFDTFCVWRDGNADGASDPGELEPLRHSPVVALEFDYRKSMRRDSSGNYYRYSARAFYDGPNGMRLAHPYFDVLLTDE